MMKSGYARKSVTAILLSVLLCTGLPTTQLASARQPSTSSVEVWLTDLSQNLLLSRQRDIPMANAAPANIPIIAIDSNRQYQAMVGYGASFTDSSAWLVYNRLDAATRATLMQELFSRSDGIGLGMVRQPMGASDFSVTGNYSYDDMPPGQTDPNLAHFSVEHDVPYIVPVLKDARRINPSLKISATPWSPPGWMKTTDSMIGGSLTPQGYQSLADYFVRFLQAYRSLGVPIDYITPQNEPLYEPGGYPGMLMTPQEQQVFIRDYLGPAIARAGLMTKLWAYDHNWDAPDYPETIYSAPQAASYVDATAWHCYGGDVSAQTAVHNAYPNEDAHLTECSGGDWQGTTQEAFDGVIGLVINSPRNWARSVVLWNMALDDENGPTNNGCLTCRGVVTIHSANGHSSYTKNVDYYALGHASKFVQPGARRVASGALSAQGIDDVAFKNPDGSNVLIAHNTGLMSQAFQVAWGNRTFRYTLNPGAAVTFRWTGEQRGSARHDPELASTVDIPFKNPDGSRVLLTYSPEQVNYQQIIRSGMQTFTYSLPVGASLATGGAETTLPTAGWKATASASGPDDPPSSALDGDSTTRWSLGHGQTNGDWFQVDMGAVRSFSGLVIDSAGNTGDFARNYQVYTSNDGIHRGSAVASGPGTGQLLRVVFPTISARYIRVVITSNSGSWWSIAEFRAFNAGSSTESAKKNERIMQRGFSLPDGGRGMAFYNPSNKSVRFQITALSRQAYFYTLPARGAAIFTWNDTSKEPAPRLNTVAPSAGLPGMQVQLNGTHFGASQLASTVKFGETIAPISTWSDTAITAVVPDGATPGQTNITVLVNGRTSNTRPFTVQTTDDALPRAGWSVTASSNAPGDVPANMIDGVQATRWSTGAPQEPGQWLQVDMGSSQTFSQIVMDAGESSGDYARGYEVYVSVDGTNWGSPIASGVGNGRIIAASFPAQTARYIKVVQTQSSGSWWSIAEFYAFA